jgi:hypothetical protein
VRVAVNEYTGEFWSIVELDAGASIERMSGKPVVELLPLEKECFHKDFAEYYTGKRQNFFLTLTAFRPLWDCLHLLNDIWMRESSNLEHLTEQTHLLPKIIFMAAHARFLNAIELGFSCCIGDAYSVLRDGIESVAHAHKILKEPATAGAAWSEKHQGKTQKGTYNKIFEEKKKDNLFPDGVPGLRQLHFYYEQFCELATHTSVTSIGKSFQDVSEPGMMRWAFHYFETNPQRLAAFLGALLQVSTHMEEVFYSCFETRLKLDPELDRMRSQFLLLRQQQTQHLQKIYEQKTT